MINKSLLKGGLKKREYIFDLISSYSLEGSAKNKKFNKHSTHIKNHFNSVIKVNISKTILHGADTLDIHAQYASGWVSGFKNLKNINNSWLAICKTWEIIFLIWNIEIVGEIQWFFPKFGIDFIFNIILNSIGTRLLLCMIL